mmetsp:Transcript_10201/g.32346  ORF Transcript_10201/g.32346 Transcript_10201/m.32346 type:complete len:89 (+) Transcript_10201:416-682(+)
MHIPPHCSSAVVLLSAPSSRNARSRVRVDDDVASRCNRCLRALLTTPTSSVCSLRSLSFALCRSLGLARPPTAFLDSRSSFRLLTLPL